MKIHLLKLAIFLIFFSHSLYADPVKVLSGIHTLEKDHPIDSKFKRKDIFEAVKKAETYLKESGYLLSDSFVQKAEYDFKRHSWAIVISQVERKSFKITVFDSGTIFRQFLKNTNPG